MPLVSYVLSCPHHVQATGSNGGCCDGREKENISCQKDNEDK